MHAGAVNEVDQSIFQGTINGSATYILVFGQAIYHGDQMPNSLIYPNQLRSNGLTVADCPKHLAPKNQPSSHSIYAPMEDLTIPLKLRGVTLFFATRTPTVHEVETCRWVYMTNKYDWDPHSDTYQEQESNYEELLNNPEYVDRNIMSLTTTRLYDPFKTVMTDISQCYDDRFIIASTSTSKREMTINAKKMAHTWNIGLEHARKTLQCTTQKGIQNTLYPIERCYRTKQAQLRYRQLSGRHGRFYTDTFFTSVPSLNGSKMAQIYINDLSLTKVYTTGTLQAAM